jgi:membrane protease YdiL (CAAX protease family)
LDFRVSDGHESSEGYRTLGAGEGVVIAFVCYCTYVVSSLILYYFVSLKTGAAVSSAVLAGSAYYLVRRAVGKPWRYVRLRSLKPGLVLYTVVATVALIPVAASLMGVVISFFEIPEEWLDAAYELVKADNLSDLLFIWLVTAVLVPWGEEFVFRGVLQNSLSSRFHPTVAVLIASTAFAVLHIWRFPAAFVLGVLLGTLYVWTGSLVAPVIAHITINSVVVVGTFLLERADPEGVPPWLLDWMKDNSSVPTLVLGISLAAFTVFLRLIWMETRRGRRKAAYCEVDSSGDETL